MSHNYLKSDVYSLEHTPADHCPIRDANSVLDVQKSLTPCRNMSRFLLYPCSWSNAFTCLHAFMENYLRLSKETENWKIRLESFQKLFFCFSCDLVRNSWALFMLTLHFHCIGSDSKYIMLPGLSSVLWHQKCYILKCCVYIVQY